MDDRIAQILLKSDCVGPITLKYERCEDIRFEKGDTIEIDFSDGDILEVTVIDVIYHDDQSIELTVKKSAEGQKEKAK